MVAFACFLCRSWSLSSALGAFRDRFCPRRRPLASSLPHQNPSTSIRNHGFNASRSLSCARLSVGGRIYATSEPSAVASERRLWSFRRALGAVGGHFQVPCVPLVVASACPPCFRWLLPASLTAVAAFKCSPCRWGSLLRAPGAVVARFAPCAVGSRFRSLPVSLMLAFARPLRRRS